MCAVITDARVLDQETGFGEIEPIEPIGGAASAPLRCVWSDLLDGCSCHSGIPEGVVEAAWQRELEASGDDEARFFHLIHNGGVWQAYGLGDGRVRGVYCPSHNSQRAARSRAAICRAADVAYEIPLAA
jgi:hypothetical protein